MKTRVSRTIGTLATVALLLVLGLIAAAVANQPPVLAAPSQKPSGSVGLPADVAHVPTLPVTVTATIFLPSIPRNYPPPPPPQYALQFDGVDDFASIADKGDFDFAQALTVEVWVKPLFIPTGQRRIDGLVAGTLAEPPAPWVDSTKWYLIQVIDQFHGEFVGVTWGMCVDSHPDLCEGVSAQGVLQANRWDHLAATYDGSQMTMYQNGQRVDGAPEYGNVLDVSFVTLGRVVDSFHGLIDEVRIWNVARTQAQIQADMNRTLTGNEPGLVGYWRLDEGTGQAIMDTSPHHNDGRLGTSTGADPQDPVWVVSDAPVQ